MTLRWLSALALTAWVASADPVPLLAQTPDEHQSMSAPSTTTLGLRAFGSVDWGTTTLEQTANSFAIGQFDVFVASTLSERVSVLAEIVLEAGTNTRVVVDLERLLLTFRLNDYFQVGIGRFHTGIGYYNAAFHHAAFFETPTGRPRIFRFEDEGGVLPVHDTGITVHGVVPRTGSSLRYLAEIGNGRSWNVDETGQPKEGVLDQNDAKATNVGLSYRPERWRGLEVGATYYRDDIPQSPGVSIPFRLATAYLVYRHPSFEILAEQLWFTHDTPEARYSNDAAYIQASKAWGKLRPYYRFDRQTIDPRTPFIGTAGSYRAHIVGLRIDPSDLVGVKAQYERSDEQGQRGVDTLRAQLVFVF
jgi:hypothetical protein